jgi:hypothetical protein
MAWIAALALSWAAGGDVPEIGERLPSIGELEWQEKTIEVDAPIGVEVFAVWTRFDTGLKIEDHAGVGADLQFGWDYGVTTLWLSLGYAGWDTQNDEDELAAAEVRIRQYRAGVSTYFSWRVLELGVGVTGGLYRFKRRHENDTSPFVEFEGSLGVRPVPAVRLGVLGLATHTQSSFNREHTHLFHNYSIGPFVEVRF